MSIASDVLPNDTVDTVVIGGGAAGLNGALMLARSRRSVVVVDSGTPRNAPSHAVHGLLGLDGTPPAELYQRGREEVRSYGGLIAAGHVESAQPAPAVNGDQRFTVTLAGTRTITARRLLIATGLNDVLPDIPGITDHWGRDVVHCPYCHGWEVRDEPIGILAVGPASIHHALLFRQLTDDLVYFTRGTDLDADTREKFAARDILVIDIPVEEMVTADSGRLAGVRLANNETVARRVLAVATTMHARAGGLEDLRLPMEDLPNGMGRRFSSGLAGTTEIPGVWVAGNATDLTAQVGAAAAAGALAGGHINADLANADTVFAVSTPR